MVAPWSFDRRRKLVELYQSGMTLLECCQALDTTGTQTAQKYLHEAGVTLRPAKRRPPTQARKQQIVDAYLSGDSVATICRGLRVASGVVAQALRESGVEVRFATWTEKKISKAVDLYAQGLTVVAVARKMGSNRGCVRKYLRLRGVDIRLAVRRGKEHGNWNGGLAVGDYIYLCSPGHPYRTKSGYVLEHRLVMEKHLGRYLLPFEVVHHRDKDKHNNALDNLELFSSNAEHLASELKGRCPKWSEEGRNRIRESAERRRAKTQSRTRSKTDAPS